MSQKRARIFCIGLIALLGLPAAADHTNVVVILMDDVGTDFLPMFDAVNPYEGDPPDDGQTHLYAVVPRLEALAAEGVTFLNAYAMPMCSPTRASLYTGNYPVRHGVGSLVFSRRQGDLREFGDPGYEFTTLAEIAQSRGYADALIGKWHLGMPGPLMDEEFGSDCYLGWSSISARGKWTDWMCTFRGITSSPIPDPDVYGHPSYYNYYFSEEETDHAKILAQGPETEYATVVQFDTALEWCNQQTGAFLCVIAPNAAHSPWDHPPPEELVNTREYLNGDINAFTQHAAMIESIDTKLGDFIDGLAPGVRSQTIFIVIGDNGTPKVCLEHARLDGTDSGAVGSDLDLGPTYDALLDAPEPRFKGSVFEKGTRVPMIVSGPGIVQQGRISQALVDIVDLFPTIAELIGADAGDVHGISFVPVLQGDPDGNREFTFVESFLPLGSTAPEAVFEQRWIGCSLRIQGQGRFKVVRDSVLGEDRLYQLQGPDDDYVDPWELSPLDHGPQDPLHEVYLAVTQKLDSIVASGASTGGSPCGYVQTFCPVLPNSSGLPAVMSVAGTRSLCVNDLRLQAELVPVEKSGIFFYSDLTTELPFGDGVLCLGGNVTRLEVVQSLPPGIVQYAFDSREAELLAGQTRHFQFWYRDPTGPGGTGFNLSDALSMTFCP